MKIVLIVPTKDRPKDIQNLFSSLIIQSRKPDSVIVVDGSDQPIKSTLEQYTSELNLNYIPCRPPSLPKQRNVGIKNLPADTDWVGFLDDDLVLEPDALENLEKLIIEKNDPKLKGVGLCILNQQSSKMKFLLRFFMMSSKRPGTVTISGYHTAIPSVEKDIETDWLYGGATFWSKDIFDSWSRQRRNATIITTKFQSQKKPISVSGK